MTLKEIKKKIDVLADKGNGDERVIATDHSRSGFREISDICYQSGIIEIEFKEDEKQEIAPIFVNSKTPMEPYAEKKEIFIMANSDLEKDGVVLHLQSHIKRLLETNERLEQLRKDDTIEFTKLFDRWKDAEKSSERWREELGRTATELMEARKEIESLQPYKFIAENSIGKRILRKMDKVRLMMENRTLREEVHSLERRLQAKEYENRKLMEQNYDILHRGN